MKTETGGQAMTKRESREDEWAPECGARNLVAALQSSYASCWDRDAEGILITRKSMR